MTHNGIDPELATDVIKAESALQKEKYSKAVDLYTKVLKDPRSSRLSKEYLSALYISRGFGLRHCGSQHAALADYEEAARLNPDSFKPHINAGLIYAQDFQRYREAIEEFDKCLQLNPTCAEAYSSRGLAKMFSGGDEEANKDFSAALRLEPNNINALCNKGNLYLKQGRPQEAADMYRQALTVNPRDSETRVNLAIALSQMGSEEAARSVLQQDKKAAELWASKGGTPVRPPMSWWFVLFAIAAVAVAVVVVLYALRQVFP